MQVHAVSTAHCIVAIRRERACFSPRNINLTKFPGDSLDRDCVVSALLRNGVNFLPAPINRTDSIVSIVCLFVKRKQPFVAFSIHFLLFHKIRIKFYKFFSLTLTNTRTHTHTHTYRITATIFFRLQSITGNNCSCFLFVSHNNIYSYNS